MNLYSNSRFLIFVIVLFLQGCFVTPQQRLNNLEITNSQTIFDTRQKDSIKRIDFSQLLEQLSQSQTVLIGETHTNYNHHLAQLLIIKSLIKKIPSQTQKGIVFEMLPTNTQNLIDKLQNRIFKGETFKSSEIPALINWEKGWNYSMYEGLITYTLNSPYKLLAGNLSREEINIVISGAMPLNGHESTAPNVQEKIKNIIADSHRVDPKDALLTNLVSAQQFKDRRMAESLLKTEFSVLIAGRFHASNTIGVPLHLRDLSTNRKVLSVILLEGNVKMAQDLHSESDFDPNEADFIWILPHSN